jgi:hypothetical protein
MLYKGNPFSNRADYGVGNRKAKNCFVEVL